MFANVDATELEVLTIRITVDVTNVALTMHWNVTLVLELLLWATEAEVLAEVGHLDDTVAVGGEGVQMGLCSLGHGGVPWRRTALKNISQARTWVCT